MADAASQELRAKRLRRIAQEVEDEGVDLSRAALLFGDWRAQPFDSRQWEEMVLEELTYARHPPIHEGRRPSYGAIIREALDEGFLFPPQGGSLMRVHGEATLESLRPFANGVTTFIVRTMGGQSALLTLQRSDEAAISALCGYEAAAVQRHPSGTVRVFAGRGIYVYEGDEWAFKVYGHRQQQLLAHLAGLASKPQRDIANSLLDFCLHVLSARHIGATLVWRAGGEESPLSGLSRPPRELPVYLNIADREHFDAIATLLASVDGACILNSHGRVDGYEAFLDNSPRSKDMIPSIGGTRHTTAARYSFDDSHAIVFVVSADGPVSIFSDGIRLIRVDVDRGASSPIPPVLPIGERFRPVELEGRTRECGGCGKRLRTVAAIDPGTDRLAELEHLVSCPICGAEAAAIRCLGVTVRVLKPWEGDEAKVAYATDRIGNFREIESWVQGPDEPPW